MQILEYSFIIPVFNRPEEIKELLTSFLKLDFNRPFEIVIIEDGSTETSKEVVNSFTSKLNISYYFKENSGPGDSRNFGMSVAKGNYFLILDSDVILPPQYLLKVDAFLNKSYVDFFGGPDAADQSFSDVQKAINFSMTSFITTGGIRGHKTQIHNFQPRSFNMGISKLAFQKSQGFGKIHPGEDPDLSLRLLKLGFESSLIVDAFVYHKRRISWNKFYTQVNKFGKARPILNTWHPESKSIMFWLPFMFSFGLIVSIICLSINFYFLTYLYMLYFTIAFVLALVYSKSITIATQSLFAILIQFTGYGLGFIKSVIQINVLKKDPKVAFPELFY